MNYAAFKEAVFAQAKALGLTEYELYYSAGEESSVETYKTEVKGFATSKSQGACFRCLVDGKMGYASTSLLSQEEAERLVEHAMDNAATLETTEEQFIYAGDEHYAEITPKPVHKPNTEELTNFALRLQKDLYAGDSRIVDGTQTQVAYESREVAIDNSYGLSLHQERALNMALAMPVLQADESYDAYQIELGNLDEIDTVKLAAKAIEKASAQVGAEGGPTGTMPVILAPDAVHSLLSVFSAVFSAENTQKGLSLLAGKEGQKIAADCVTLMDDPLYKDGYGQTAFDDEGCATSPKAVIENGVLKTILHNLKTAHVAGVKTTANASKAGYAAPVGISPYTFYFCPGEKDQEALMAQMGEGLLISSMTGMHAGASAVSGDFSLQSNGFRVENGKKGKAIRNFTVAGNFFELLKHVEAVGSDLKLDTPSGSTCFGSPSLLVSGLSMAGK